jgi:putative heme transporter
VSRFRRTAIRARRLWIGMRLNARADDPSGGHPRRAVMVEAEDAGEPEESSPQHEATPAGIPDSGRASEERHYIPLSLAVGAAWAWRLIVILAATLPLFWLFSQIPLVVIPLAVSFLLAAMLQPIAGWLMRHGWNKSLASIVVLIAGLAAVGGTLTFVIQQFIDGVPQFGEQFIKGLEQAQEWLESGPFGLDGETVAELLVEAQENITRWLNENQSEIAQNAVAIVGGAATGLFYFISGFFLVLFTTYFFMRDGKRIWHFVTGMLPTAAREPMRFAGGAGWSTLVQYMRTMIVVALVDAVGIGFGLWILNIPLWLPLATLVFLGGFIPIVGAVASGAVAVLVAVVATDNPLVNGLLVLGIVLLVQQIESNVLHPLLMSRAVRIHPLAIVLGVTGGGFMFGIVGALIAVPLLAITNATVRALHHHRELRREAEARRREEATEAGQGAAESGELAEST